MVTKKVQNLAQIATKRDLSALGGELRIELKQSFGALKEDIVLMKDEIMGELKTVREEQMILSSQHGRILDLEEKVEKLEKIHPRSQHTPI